MFLKVLMSFHENLETQDLKERLAHAERNERCLLIACWLVGGATLAGLAGLAYSAVLHPQFFENSTPVLVRFFSALSLGSVLCLLGFIGLWLHYRRVANRVHEECRRVVLTALQVRFAGIVPPLALSATFSLEEFGDPHLQIRGVDAPPVSRDGAPDRGRDDLHHAA